MYTLNHNSLNVLCTKFVFKVQILTGDENSKRAFLFLQRIQDVPYKFCAWYQIFAKLKFAVVWIGLRPICNSNHNNKNDKISFPMTSTITRKMFLCVLFTAHDFSDQKLNHIHIHCRTKCIVAEETINSNSAQESVSVMWSCVW